MATPTMPNAHMVTIHLNAAGHEHTTELRHDAFLAGVTVIRRGDKYEATIGPAVRVKMPRPVAVEFVSDLLSLLEREDRLAILAEAEKAHR